MVKWTKEGHRRLKEVCTFLDETSDADVEASWSRATYELSEISELKGKDIQVDAMEGYLSFRWGMVDGEMQQESGAIIFRGPRSRTRRLRSEIGWRVVH